MNPNIAALRSVSPQHKAAMAKAEAERDAAALAQAQREMLIARERLIAEGTERVRREVVGNPFTRRWAGLAV